MKQCRNLLRRGILTGCGAFVVLLCLTLGVFGFFIYYQGIAEKSQTYIGDAPQSAGASRPGRDAFGGGAANRRFKRLHGEKEHGRRVLPL